MEETRLRLEADVEVAAYSSAPTSTQITVVLLHGIGMSHLTWAKVQPLLADRARVISLDLPGFGATRRPGRRFDLTDFSDAVDAACQRLGVGNRLLVGHSMGTQVAVELAARSPAPVTGLVLVGPVTDPARRTVRSQAARLALDTMREPPWVNGRVLTDYVKGGVGWYLSTLGPMLDYPIEERIRDITCPVLVMRGELDPVAPSAWCHRLAGNAPGWSRVVTVPGKSHVIPLTDADGVNEAVRLVLDRSSGQPRAQGAPEH